jgi:hypothetical protein
LTYTGDDRWTEAIRPSTRSVAIRTNLQFNWQFVDVSDEDDRTVERTVLKATAHDDNSAGKPRNPAPDGGCASGYRLSWQRPRIFVVGEFGPVRASRHDSSNSAALRDRTGSLYIPERCAVG